MLITSEILSKYQVNKELIEIFKDKHTDGV
jgi:hypothetical protein